MKKKKNLLKIFCLLLGLFSLTGCFKRDDMEDISIVVSTYPIEYIVKSLYGAYSNIDSIYPSGVDVNNYELTDKQINDYSKNTLFVYNGLSDEKNIARSFLNQNRNMKIIDVSYGLNIEYGKTSEELWLSPNNYLMLATTTKNNLSDFINSKYLIQMIDTNYKKLQEDLSLMDANLRSIGASSKKPIITTTNTLKYLENYGFKETEIKWLEENVCQTLKKALIEEQKLVGTNIGYLKNLGVLNYKEIFNNYYGMFLMDNSVFTEIFNKYDQADLVDKLQKNIAIVEYL